MESSVSKPTNDDRRLVSLAIAGDRDARRALFELHRESAYRVAYRVTRREADALDVVQDAFIKAFESLGDFQQGASFRTWLLRIVTNRALDLVRSRRVRLAVSLDGGRDEGEPGVEAPAPTAAPDRRLSDHELATRLQRAIDELPAEQRAVFALFATGEMTYAEIAEVLTIPIGTVMSRLFHARRKLQTTLSDISPGAAQKFPTDVE